MNTVSDELNQLRARAMISPTLISRELIDARGRAALGSARRKASDTLMRPLHFLHRIIQASELSTALHIHYFTVSDAFLRHRDTVSKGDNAESDTLGMLSAVYVAKGTHTRCSCENNGSCAMPGHLFLYEANDRYGLYDLNTMMPNETLQGIVIDCVPLQTALASSLKCFYNHTCLNILLSAYQTPMMVTRLSDSSTTRFDQSSKIELLVRELFLLRISRMIHHSINITYNVLRSIAVILIRVGSIGSM